MRKHTQVYMRFFKYTKGDFIPCEISGRRAVDVHHIDARGMGGNGEVDVIENLMAITRELHLEYGDKEQYMEGLIQIHESFILTSTPWMELHDKLPWQ